MVPVWKIIGRSEGVPLIVPLMAAQFHNSLTLL
jgi:hypothetical protein